jgi:hypothetical protein
LWVDLHSCYKRFTLPIHHCNYWWIFYLHLIWKQTNNPQRERVPVHIIQETHSRWNHMPMPCWHFLVMKAQIIMSTFLEVNQWIRYSISVPAHLHNPVRREWHLASLHVPCMALDHSYSSYTCTAVEWRANTSMCILPGPPCYSTHLIECPLYMIIKAAHCITLFGMTDITCVMLWHLWRVHGSPRWFNPHYLMPFFLNINPVCYSYWALEMPMSILF